jgi:NADPH:quinone reductase-like Zn-dependent oxidoreductase
MCYNETKKTVAMQVLVTGAAGTVGTALIDHLEYDEG